MPYKLSATLSAHSSDVRAVASPTNDLVISASRDTTAISWTRTPGASTFAQAAVLRAGSRYINAVTYVPPTSDAPSGYAVTGGQDTVVNVFSLENTSGEPNFSLIGHTENVCALHTAPDGTIISGSWDRTAKVWKGFQLAYDLQGHQQSVWAVLAMDGRQFLTGSADNTVKLWSQHKNVRTYPGHKQAVRALALITDIGFASCSNDSEIRIWTMEGDVVYTLSGHTSFVYSLSVLPNGDIVSGGEDRTVRVWRDGECVQTLVHPAISVWAVSAMPNGDIVTGCSDGVVRIFSSAEQRWAPADQLKAFEEQVASQALPMQQIGDVKKSDLPGMEVLSQPGKKSGDVRMIKNGDMVEAHQWDSASSSWQKIGDVVDAVGSNRKQLYEGKEYDYVFDVDVQEGVPPLKLPYNVNENPYSAAQRFLERNELPLTYLDEVVKFIETNTAGVNIGSSSNQYADPFTGASRYQPSQSASAGSAPEYMDPFTGSSRYRAAPPAVASPTSSYSDPYTGSSRYTGASSPPSTTKTPPKAILPVRTPLLFRQANISAMQAKLRSLNDALRNEISTSALIMYPPEEILIDEIFTRLSAIVAHSSGLPSKFPDSGHLDALIHVLERWPPSAVFPLLDLARLLIGFFPRYYGDNALEEPFWTALLKGAQWNEPWTAPLPKERETGTLFVLRALANSLQEHETLTEDWLARVLRALSQARYTVLTKTPRVALATILLNLSCLFIRMRLSAELWSAVLNYVFSILQIERTDSEAAYRALVALGNIAYAAKEQKRPFNASQRETAVQCLTVLVSALPEDRIRNVAAEIKALL
ncbi:phospholipase A-2-activating protein [Amylocystis lapponica]|nr:phospholipase A-2-activating protein [Amylocystis lapponica]